MPERSDGVPKPGGRSVLQARRCIRSPLGRGHSMTTEIATVSKARPALTRREKAANREAIKELAAKHSEAAIKKLSEIVSDRNSPASAKVAAATQLLDRVAGKPKLIDEKQTEQSQLDKMSSVELLQYTCDNLSKLSADARAVVAQSLIAAERGISLDVRDVIDEGFEAPAELPPLERTPKSKREPRR